ncbi:CPBP family intramembrane glutamic endopeptidase [Lachnotalea glycerini]|uniref:CPBP family intramembrane metalloprotease n=1 Tax=Lachnotalea glycerini TaxID=1763509 RepID=A0A371JGB6_9FIRM|nr:type II CAAX endopeptidase family protein [Lachnotalea glycerini]RDY31794.1 CPBP family intramembrane metalloprotease [Lachnotalea glycerini]
MRNTLKADLLFFIMVLIHLGAVTFFTVLSIRKISVEYSTNQSLLLSQLLILIPVGIYLLITKTNPFKLIRFKKIDVATIFMVILLTFLIMPLITFINSVSMLFSNNNVLTLTNELTGNSFLLNLLLMAVIPAISEEFVFRGILFHTYRKSSVLYGVVISGIVFGLMHLNFNQFSYAFVLGIVFALLIEATGSIYSTMIAHFFINGNSVVIMALSNKVWGGLEQSSQQLQSQLTPKYLIMIAGVYGIIAVGTTALAIGVYIWIGKHCKRENHLRAVFMIRKGEDKFILRKAISIPLIVSIVLCLSYMVLSEVVQANYNENVEIEQDVEDIENTLSIEL